MRFLGSTLAAATSRIGPVGATQEAMPPVPRDTPEPKPDRGGIIRGWLHPYAPQYGERIGSLRRFGMDGVDVAVELHPADPDAPGVRWFDRDDQGTTSLLGWVEMRPGGSRVPVTVQYVEREVER